MTMQTYALTPARIDKFKGEILKHAVPQETLCRMGRQVRMPKNSSKTYIARRFLPQASAAAEESLHVWLDLPAAWDGDSLRRAAQQRGLSLVGAEAFATGSQTRNGVRISLGGPETQDVLTTALLRIAELVAQDPPKL